MASHDQPVIYTAPVPFDLSEANFTQDTFVSSINKHGYELQVERAMRCPCINRASGQPLLNCQNCGGTSWFFINKRVTRGVAQRMGRETKYRDWTEESAGRVQITFLPGEDVTFMDRVVNTSLESTFSERLGLVNIAGEWRANTIYFPNRVINAFIFVSPTDPLRVLNPNQYSITDNRFLITDNSVLSGISLPSYPFVSIRYHHSPTWHVLDVMRERMASRENDCETGISGFKLLPTHVVALRAHNILDAPSLSGQALFDNSHRNEGQDF